MTWNTPLMYSLRARKSRDFESELMVLAPGVRGAVFSDRQSIDFQMEALSIPEVVF